MLQVVKVHQDTVDGYFRTMCESSMDSTADRRARKEFEEIASHWESVLRQAEQKFTAEEEASDLVYNFVIPEVSRCFFYLFSHKTSKSDTSKDRRVCICVENL